MNDKSLVESLFFGIFSLLLVRVEPGILFEGRDWMDQVQIVWSNHLYEVVIIIEKVLARLCSVAVPCKVLPWFLKKN